MNTSLHIEKLILDGLSLTAAQGPVFQAALEGELTRLLGERGLAGVSGGAVPHLSVPAIQLAAGGRPDDWGRQIARSLLDGLAPSPVRPAQPQVHAATSPSPPFHRFNPKAAPQGR